MIIYHQNNRGAFARNRVWYWMTQPLLHPRISVTSAAAPAPSVHLLRRPGLLAATNRGIGV